MIKYNTVMCCYHFNNSSR